MDLFNESGSSSRDPASQAIVKIVSEIVCHCYCISCMFHFVFYLLPFMSVNIVGLQIYKRLGDVGCLSGL